MKDPDIDYLSSKKKLLDNFFFFLQFQSIDYLSLSNRIQRHLNILHHYFSWFMNHTSRTIYNSSSTHLFERFNFQLKFDSFKSWIKFNELITESSLKRLHNVWISHYKHRVHILEKALWANRSKTSPNQTHA